MAWQTDTVTGEKTGNIVINPGTQVEAAIVAVPANAMITAYWVQYQLGLGTGASFNSVPPGTYQVVVPWIFGISYVQTGGTVPDISASPDDPQVLMLDHMADTYVHDALVTAPLTSYVGIIAWANVRKGRVQEPSGINGGNMNFHINNRDTTSHDTNWRVFLRMSYAPLV